MMGAIINPLFQNKKRMMGAGLCTDSQYEHGYEELMSRLVRYYDSLSKNSNVAVSAPSVAGTPVENKWSDGEDDDVLLVSESALRAKAELDKYETWKKFKFLPRVKPVKTLGGFDSIGHKEEEAAISIGPVIDKGEGAALSSGKNHANYIDQKGYYDIVGLLLYGSSN
eukprot:scaffold74496_cov26-Cyclotella_meneghiniana.AAC.1